MSLPSLKSWIYFCLFFCAGALAQGQSTPAPVKITTIGLQFYLATDSGDPLADTALKLNIKNKGKWQPISIDPGLVSTAVFMTPASSFSLALTHVTASGEKVMEPCGEIAVPPEATQLVVILLRQSTPAGLVITVGKVIDVSLEKLPDGQGLIFNLGSIPLAVKVSGGPFMASAGQASGFALKPSDDKALDIKMAAFLDTKWRTVFASLLPVYTNRMLLLAAPKYGDNRVWQIINIVPSLPPEQNASTGK